MKENEIKKSLSRRTFIKGAALSAGALAAVGIGAPKNALALPMPKKWDKEFDVVVLGGGIAGFSAAIEAGKAGAKVGLLEKQPMTGGSSAICDGLFSCALSAVQKQKGINDSPDLFFKDMMAFGAGRSDQALVRTYVDGSNDAFEFLKAMGVKFGDELKQFAGMSVPRIHVIKGSDGSAFGAGTLMRTMKAEAEKLGVQIMTKTAGKRLYTNPNGRVVGIKAETGTKKGMDINARKAVILATGGFARNPELLKEYDHRRTDVCIPTSGLGSTGDGLKMGFEVGAGAKNMSISINEGAPVDFETKLLSGAFYSGAVIVNKEGKRFVNESIGYPKIAELCTAQPDGIMINIFDAPIHARDPFIKGVSPRKADTLQELAALLGIKPEALVAEIDKYNRYVETGKDLDFGRKTVVGPFGKPVPIKTPPFYGTIAQKGLLVTKGGLTINEHAQLLNVFGEVIPNVYAVGEQVGGIIGESYHTGAYLGSGVVFGRIAGKNAAKEKEWA